MSNKDLSLQDHALIDRLREELRNVRREDLQASIGKLAESLSAGDNATRLVALLASSAEPTLRHLTVELAARLPAPLDVTILPFLRYLLNDQGVPEVAKIDLAAAMLRTTGGAGSQAVSVLGALVTGLGKASAIERLRRLERKAGSCPAIAELCDRFEEKLMVTCPRCSARLCRPEMIQHLWEEHRLVVEGHSVREPWRLIEDWLDAYYQQNNPELLARCRELAVRAAPQQGMQRLHRLLLVHQISDEASLQALLAEARQRHSSLCPHCFAWVEMPVVDEIKPLNVSRGRLTAGEYRVEVSESGLLTTLTVETPRGVIQQGREPDRKLTSRGALLVLAGPLVLLALTLAAVFPWEDVPVLFPVSFLLLIALMLAIVTEVHWRARRSAFERALDYAWTLLAPTLHAKGFDAEDSAFLTGLALVSAGHGDASARNDLLIKLIDATTDAVVALTVPAAHLAALWRLAAADAARAGTAPVPLLVDQAGHVFDGKFPLGYLEPLLSGAAAWLDPGQQARLRVQLCDRAFEAGHELRDLIEASRIVPALGAALVIELPDALAQLRLLWSLRRDVPWAGCGSATTAFELAEHVDAGDKHLGKHPDLLLAAWDIPGGYVCARGMIFHDTIISEFPRTLEVKGRAARQGGGFDLILGEQRFWFREDPEMLVVRLEGWLRYYFHEFRPQVVDVFRWRPPQLPSGHFQFQVVPCPECERRMIPRVGEVGVKAE